MNIARINYRTRQFWKALQGKKRPVPDEALRGFLSPAQEQLFRRMHVSEQAHAYDVLQHLQAANCTEPDLFTAALLHDVGKVLSPLSLLDRVVIVMGKRLFPGRSKRWGKGQARGWRRPFVVAAHHAAWGADLAKQAGCSAITVELIRRHDAPLKPEAASPLERLQAALQAADEEN
jgi:hypothetical protein